MIKLLPHQIACALYIQIILNKFKQANSWTAEVTEDGRSKALLFAVKLIRDSDVTWQELQLQLRSVLEDSDLATLIKEFHKLQYTEQLMEAMKSFELLLDITHKLPNESYAGFVTRSSVLGTFIRKLVLEFKKMSFDSVIGMRRSIAEYLRSSLVGQKSLLGNSTIDMNTSDISCMEESLLDGEKENISCKPLDTSFLDKSSCVSEEILLSRNQVMRFISEQVKLVESYDINALPPNKLQEKIIEIRNLYPDIKEVYYLSFMNYLRVSEGNKAAIALQLYFDYKEFAGDVNEGEITELEKHQLKFKAFRYCALNLGIMHCHHGNYSQAMISLEECIQIAQQTNDQKCLNNAMFWLSIVKEETNDLGEGSHHLKAFVADISKKIIDTESHSSLQEIDYLGLLKYTKLQVFKGLIAPSKGLDVIANIIPDQKVSKVAQLVRSSLLDFYGFKHCAILGCQVPLQNIKSFGSSRKMECNAIENKLLTTALCQIARLHASESLYKEATCILLFARNQFSLYSPFRKTLTLCELQIEFNYTIGIRNLKQAHSIAKSVSRIDDMEGKYMVAEADLVFGNVSSATKSAAMLLSLIEKKSIAVTKTPALKAKLLILLIEAKLLSSNLSGALDLIFKLIDFVQSRSMYGALIDANVCLIRCQLLLGLVGKAKDIVYKTLYQALAFGSYYQKGLLFYLTAKCITSDYNDSDDGEKDVLLEASNLLDKSMQYFTGSQFIARLKDILYEKAFIYHKVGNFQDRNKVSTHFRTLHEKLESYLPVVMF